MFRATLPALIRRWGLTKTILIAKLGDPSIAATESITDPSGHEHDVADLPVRSIKAILVRWPKVPKMRTNDLGGSPGRRYRIPGDLHVALGKLWANLRPLRSRARDKRLVYVPGGALERGDSEHLVNLRGVLLLFLHLVDYALGGAAAKSAPEIQREIRKIARQAPPVRPEDAPCRP